MVRVVVVAGGADELLHKIWVLEVVALGRKLRAHDGGFKAQAQADSQAVVEDLGEDVPEIVKVELRQEA